MGTLSPVKDYTLHVGYNPWEWTLEITHNNEFSIETNGNISWIYFLIQQSWDHAQWDHWSIYFSISCLPWLQEQEQFSQHILPEILVTGMLGLSTCKTLSCILRIYLKRENKPGYEPLICASLLTVMFSFPSSSLHYLQCKWFKCFIILWTAVCVPLTVTWVQCTHSLCHASVCMHSKVILHQAFQCLFCIVNSHTCWTMIKKKENNNISTSLADVAVSKWATYIPGG